jgi:DNA-binding CsgD family transcriptional regulator
VSEKKEDSLRQFESLYEFAPCGYLSLNAKGLIDSINRAGVTFLGSTRSRLLRTDFSRSVGSQCRGPYIEALRIADETAENQGLELQLVGNGGSIKWIWAEIQADHNEAGKLLQWRMTLLDITAKKENEIALAASEKKYRQLFCAAVTGAALLEVVRFDRQGRAVDVRILEVNPAFERMAKRSCDQMIGNSIRGLWPGTEDTWLAMADHVLRGDPDVQMEGFHQDSGKHVLVSCFRLDDLRFGITVMDISIRKELERSREQSRLKLEKQVKERTAQIARINSELLKEIETRRSTEAALLENSKELQVRSTRLKEANTALRVLLRERENERGELEERVVCNINELVRPHLQKLFTGNPGKRQQALLNAISRGLDDITSPLSRRLIMESSRLTPLETQVAGLIRQGRTTKEISELLGVAPSTVDFHRLNIRRKLNLTNKRANLRSYLMSLN